MAADGAGSDLVTPLRVYSISLKRTCAEADTSGGDDGIKRARVGQLDYS